MSQYMFLFVFLINLWYMLAQFLGVSERFFDSFPTPFSDDVYASMFERFWFHFSFILVAFLNRFRLRFPMFFRHLFLNAFLGDFLRFWEEKKKHAGKCGKMRRRSYAILGHCWSAYYRTIAIAPSIAMLRIGAFRHLKGQARTEKRGVNAMHPFWTTFGSVLASFFGDWSMI